MSKEATPLQRVMNETNLVLADRLRELTLSVHGEITAENGFSASPTQIAAALFMISQLAGAQAEIIRETPPGSDTHPKMPALPEGSDLEKLNGANKLTTFSELLRSKIDQKLLPPQQVKFIKTDLRRLTEELGYGAKEFLKSNPPVNDNSTREQAIDFIEKFLRVDHKPDRNSPYTKAHILADWGISAKLIDIWAKEINLQLGY